MLISEAITYCEYMTGQVVAPEQLVRWLSELDGRLAFEFYRTGEWAPYDPTDDTGAELLVPFPWDGLYVHHLAAKTYFSNGEYDRYENERVMSEQTLADFRSFMQRTQAALCGCGFPTDKTGGTYVTVIPEQASSLWFWIDAYSLAVKHGFSGTEEEWLASLKGNPGPKGDPGEKGEDGNSFIVLGLYATLAALEAAHPTGNSGDAYAVGTDSSNTIYNWDTDQNAWVNIGSIKGPAGADGQDGADGVGISSISKTSTAGLVDTYTITYTDSDTDTFTVTNGADGQDGQDGAPGPNTVTSSTTTNLTGLLAGDGSNVTTMGLDTSGLTNDSTHVPASSVVKSAIDNLTIKETLTDLNLNAVGAISRTGNTVTLYIESPTSAMTQSVAYSIGNLPTRYVPYASMNYNKFTSNGRDYYLNINGQAVSILTNNTLPGTGIPNIQGYITWFAKYDM